MIHGGRIIYAPVNGLLINVFSCRDACTKFTEIWKRKHETGQWLEIEAAEGMSSRSDFAAMNASGIVFSENNGKSGVESSTGTSFKLCCSDSSLFFELPIFALVFYAYPDMGMGI